MKKRNLLLGAIALFFVASILFFTNLGSDNENIYTPRKSELQKYHESARGAMEHLGWLRNDPVTGKVEIEDVLRAQKMFNSLSFGKANDLNWTLVGPTNIGGRTRAILVDNTNPSILYAGGVAGGLWRSTTGGSSWDTIGSIHDYLAISSITQASNGDIFVGTGESFGNGANNYTSASFSGYGIYHSANGIDFSIIPSTIPNATNGLGWLYVNELAYDDGSNRIYAATSGGLVYTDAANPITWTKGINLNGNCDDVAKTMVYRLLYRKGFIRRPPNPLNKNTEF